FRSAPCCEKRRSLVEAAANIKSQRSDDETKQKRDTPAPAIERFWRQNACDQGAQQRACEHGQALADHLPGAIKAAASGGRGFATRCVRRVSEFSTPSRLHH